MKIITKSVRNIEAKNGWYATSCAKVQTSYSSTCFTREHLIKRPCLNKGLLPGNALYHPLKADESFLCGVHLTKNNAEACGAVRSRASPIHRSSIRSTWVVATMKAKQAPRPRAFAPGDQLVGQISHLDKSEEPFSSLLEGILQLLNLPPQALDSFPSLEDLDGESTRGFSPLDVWAAKWLLRRMSTGPTDSKGPAMDHRAWCLLLRLVARLRLKLVAQLFVDFKISTVLRLTFQCLGQQAQLWAELRTTSREPAPQKRTSTEPEENGISLQDSEGLSKTFRCVAAFLEYIEAVLPRGSDSSATLARGHLRSSLQLSTEHATQTLGNTLSAMRILECRTPAFVRDAVDRQIALLRSVMFLWRSRLTPPDQKAEFDETVKSAPRTKASSLLIVGKRYFSLHCLLPALLLLSSCNKNSEDVAHQLETLVRTHYLTPSFNAYCHANTISTEESDLPFLLNETFKPLTQAGRRKHKVYLGDSNDTGADRSSVLQVPRIYDVYELPERVTRNGENDVFFDRGTFCLLLQLAIKCREQENRKTASPHDFWLSRLFAELAKCIHIEMEGSGSTSSRSARLVLCSMLNVCVEFDFSPQSELLKAVALDFCEALRKQKEYSFWVGLCNCIKLDCSIVIEHSVSEGPASLSPLLQGILDAISLESEGQNGNSFSPKYAADALWPIIDMFAQARQITRWIAIWRSELSRTFDKVAQTPDVESSHSPFSFAWSDERVCQRMAPRLVTALTQSQTVAFFLELENLLCQECSEENYARDLWALVVVAQCLLSTPWDEALEEALLEPARLIYNQGAKVIVEDLPKRLKARFWQVLTFMSDKRSAARLGRQTLDCSGSLLKYAEWGVLAVLDKKDACGDFYENELSSSCWSYVTALASSESLPGRGSHESYVGTLNGLMMKILQKLARFCTHRPRLVDDLGGSPAWDGTVSRILSEEGFLLTLLATTFVREPCLEYKNRAFWRSLG